MIIPKKYKTIINKILTIANENNFETYIVGGFVRDLIIKKKPYDLDIMIHSKKISNGILDIINFSNLIVNKYNLKSPLIFKNFGTSKILIDNKIIELTMPRKEYYKCNSRNPITKFASIKQDAFRRDFTINSLFIRLKDMKILDFTSYGINDIKNKIIRVSNPSNAEKIFNQDPLRILRAIRLSSELNFIIEPITYNAMKKTIKRIKIVSQERIKDELNKILINKTPSKAFMLMKEINLLYKILPEIKIKKDTNKKTKNINNFKILDKTKKNIILRIANLLYNFCNIYKKNDFLSLNIHIEKINYILKRLKYSNEVIKKVIFIIRNYIYYKYKTDYTVWTDNYIRKFVRKCDKDFLLIKEFIKTNYNKKNKYNKFKNRIKYLKSKNKLYTKTDLLSGEELMLIFNKPSGKWIKIIKNKIVNIKINNPTLTKNQIINIIKTCINKQNIQNTKL
jgi:tRNA nucleotidyltransferase/poly(A) polymerase